MFCLVSLLHVRSGPLCCDKFALIFVGWMCWNFGTKVFEPAVRFFTQELPCISNKQSTCVLMLQRCFQTCMQSNSLSFVLNLIRWWGRWWDSYFWSWHCILVMDSECLKCVSFLIRDLQYFGVGIWFVICLLCFNRVENAKKRIVISSPQHVSCRVGCLFWLDRHFVSVSDLGWLTKADARHSLCLCLSLVALFVDFDYFLL